MNTQKLREILESLLQILPDDTFLSLVMRDGKNSVSGGIQEINIVEHLATGLFEIVLIGETTSKFLPESEDIEELKKALKVLLDENIDGFILQVKAQEKKGYEGKRVKAFSDAIATIKKAMGRK